jgi:hypothetical protein
MIVTILVLTFIFPFIIIAFVLFIKYSNYILLCYITGYK